MVSSLPAPRNSERKWLSRTTSVCPVCLRQIDAERIIRGNEIVLQKTCIEHGFFEVPVWRGDVDRIISTPTRVPAYPENPMTVEKDGCPYDCGLCPEHRQQPCCVLFEVTQRCDLTCPYCFASSGGKANLRENHDPNLAPNPDLV